MKSELPRNASDKTQYVPLLGSTAILSHRLHQPFPTLCFSIFSVPLIAFLQLWTGTVAIGLGGYKRWDRKAADTNSWVMLVQTVEKIAALTKRGQSRRKHYYWIAIEAKLQIVEQD
jgi:hypothetical protein